MKTREWFYAFALNEYSYRRVSFTRHKSRIAAETSAYKLSGQKRRGIMRDYNGAETAQNDLYPQVIEGTDALEAWAKESSYKVDYNAGLLLYMGSR